MSLQKECIKDSEDVIEKIKEAAYLISLNSQQKHREIYN
jgi:hypothetical protein